MGTILVRECNRQVEARRDRSLTPERTKMRKPVLLVMAGALLALAVGFVATPPADAG